MHPAKWKWDGRRSSLEITLPFENTYINAYVEGRHWEVWENDKLVAHGENNNPKQVAERVIAKGNAT